MLPAIITAQNTVGAIAPNSEVKLVDLEENDNYKVEDGEGGDLGAGYVLGVAKTDEILFP